MFDILSFILLFVFLFLGMAAVKLKFAPSKKICDILLTLSLYALLFFMGVRVGRSGISRDEMMNIGLFSFFLSLAGIAGTVFILLIIYRFSAVKNPQKGKTGGGPEDNFSVLKHTKEPLRLVSAVIAGFLSGYFLPVFPEFTGERTTSWILYVLLFLIGIQLISGGINLKKTLAHPEILILPGGTIAGTVLGCGILSFFLPISLGKALAAGSGFGWYSLSGVIISDMGDPALGSVAFLSNLFREIIALLTIPFWGKTRTPNVSIGIAGATSMDVTLPLIRKACGDEAVPLSIASGAIVSLFVPILVPLFYAL